MGPADLRRRDGDLDLDVASRNGDPDLEDQAGGDSAQGSDQEPEAKSAPCREGHGRVPDQRSDLRSHGAAADRVRMETISEKLATVRLRFGDMRSPNAPRALAVARKLGWQFDILRLAPVSKTICPIRNAALAGPAVHCHELFGQ
jgi:hypothetical protein